MIINSNHLHHLMGHVHLKDMNEHNIYIWHVQSEKEFNLYHYSRIFFVDFFLQIHRYKILIVCIEEEKIALELVLGGGGGGGGGEKWLQTVLHEMATRVTLSSASFELPQIIKYGWASFPFIWRLYIVDTISPDLVDFKEINGQE
ncbi:hypothetical protein ACJX0J_011787, partial [Zea mays]